MKYTEEVKKAIEAMKDKLDNDENSWFYYDEIETIFDLLEKQQKEIERLEKTIDENIIIEPDETGCHEELNIHIKDFIPKDTIRENIKNITRNVIENADNNLDKNVYAAKAIVNTLKELLGDE